jgi:anaerobic selenocysteine-containing dehydrogenase
MNVSVKDGKVIEVIGDKTHPESKGILCPKGIHVKDILYSPDRLKHPMRKTTKNGVETWEKISWTQALDSIAVKFLEIKELYGAESIWFHKGSGHDVCSGDIRGYLHRLANVFGSPNLSCPFYNCYGPRALNMYMMTGGLPAPDAENADCIVIWGINVAETAPTRHRKIQNTVRRGAKTIIIDPRTTRLAERADIHLTPRPGTDGALALGILNVIIEEKLYDSDFTEQYTVGFKELSSLVKDYTPEKVAEITWIPEDNIINAARMYAKANSACIFLGNGLDQHTGTSQAIRAITALITITGNLDIPGGHVIITPLSFAKNSPELHTALSKEQAQKQLGKRFLLSRFEFTKFCHPPTVYKAILDEKPYPVKAAFIMAANPALTSPNSKNVLAALRKLDFLVVADIFMTETAKLADIVLPASTFLEQTYYATYQPAVDILPENPGLVMLRPMVVPPLYESWPDWKIIFELAKKMGYREYFQWEDIEEAIDEELKLTGITVEELKKHSEGVPIEGPAFLYMNLRRKEITRADIKKLNQTQFKKYPWIYRKYEKTGFRTPSGKVELFSQNYKDLGLDPLPDYRESNESPLNTALSRDYPLVLTTGAKTKGYVHAQMRNIEKLRKLMPQNLAEINSKTAQEYEISDIDRVTITSPRGSLDSKTKLSNKIMPGVVQLYHGFSDSNANVLTDDQTFDPITGSTPLRSALCKIQKKTMEVE